MNPKHLLFYNYCHSDFISQDIDVLFKTLPYPSPSRWSSWSNHSKAHLGDVVHLGLNGWTHSSLGDLQRLLLFDISITKAHMENICRRVNQRTKSSFPSYIIHVSFIRTRLSISQCLASNPGREWVNGCETWCTFRKMMLLLLLLRQPRPRTISRGPLKGPTCLISQHFNFRRGTECLICLENCILSILLLLQPFSMHSLAAA